jgi:hypothetical protein
MKYRKPEIVSIVSANAAIQGIPKGASGRDSSNLSKQTVAAYEADE